MSHTCSVLTSQTTRYKSSRASPPLLMHSGGFYTIPCKGFISTFIYISIPSHFWLRYTNQCTSCRSLYPPLQTSKIYPFKTFFFFYYFYIRYSTVVSNRQISSAGIKCLVGKMNVRYWAGKTLFLSTVSNTFQIAVSGVEKEIHLGLSKSYQRLNVNIFNLSPLLSMLFKLIDKFAFTGRTV